MTSFSSPEVEICFSKGSVMFSCGDSMGHERLAPAVHESTCQCEQGRYRLKIWKLHE